MLFYLFIILLNFLTCKAESQLHTRCCAVESSCFNRYVELTSGCLEFSVVVEPDRTLVAEAVDGLGSHAVPFDELARKELALEYYPGVTKLQGRILVNLVNVLVSDDRGHLNSCHIAFGLNVNAHHSVMVE